MHKRICHLRSVELEAMQSFRLPTLLRKDLEQKQQSNKERRLQKMESCQNWCTHTRPQVANYQTHRFHSVKYFSRASLLNTCTAKSPASIIAQPLYIRRFELGGSGSGGFMLSSWKGVEIAWARRNCVRSLSCVQYAQQTLSSLYFLYLPSPGDHLNPSRCT
jgi:hypothetical protein